MKVSFISRLVAISILCQINSVLNQNSVEESQNRRIKNIFNFQHFSSNSLFINYWLKSQNSIESNINIWKLNVNILSNKVMKQFCKYAENIPQMWESFTEYRMGIYFRYF